MIKCLLFVIICFSAPTAWSQDHFCGFIPPEDFGSVEGAAGQSARYRSGDVRTLILFGKFAGNDPLNLASSTAFRDREGNATKSATDLLDVNEQGSLAHFFHKMSYEALTLIPPASSSITTTWYSSQSANSSAYGIGAGCSSTHMPALGCEEDENNECSGVEIWHPAVTSFVKEILDAADRDPKVNFSEYDVVSVIIPGATAPDGFDSCGPAGTVLSNMGTYDDVSLGGVLVGHRTTFPRMVGFLAHEYGHLMGLHELYDRSHQHMRDNLESHSAGIGRWGVMGLGNDGWKRSRADGPNPLSAFARMQVGWLRPQTITAAQKDISLPDVHAGRTNAYRIPISGRTKEYFLVSNRQKDVNNYYDDRIQGNSGLAIWHIDESAGWRVDKNEWERWKAVDLECADGLWTTSPGMGENTESGGDHLDFFHKVENEREPQQSGGNRGDATDLWDGSSDRKNFTPETNPSTAGYSGPRPSERFPQPINKLQNLFTGIYIEKMVLSGFFNAET